jgi:hypothetical protein
MLEESALMQTQPKTLSARIETCFRRLLAARGTPDESARQLRQSLAFLRRAATPPRPLLPIPSSMTNPDNRRLLRW